MSSDSEPSTKNRGLSPIEEGTQHLSSDPSQRRDADRVAEGEKPGVLPLRQTIVVGNPHQPGRLAGGQIPGDDFPSTGGDDDLF